MNINDAYETMSEASGIEVGDTVEVLRRATTSEMGWRNCWTPEMDPLIGKQAVVKWVNHTTGIELGKEMRVQAYPFFALRLVKKAEKKVIVPDPPSAESILDKIEELLESRNTTNGVNK